MPSVFFLGATGYLGGSLLVALKQKYPDYTVTALVRNETYASIIATLGVTVVKGDFQDATLVAYHCSIADVVINTGDADNLAFITAILDGMHQRYRNTGNRGILIHTSGVAVCLDGKTDGQFDAQGKIWDDNNEDDIKCIQPGMIHGAVDHAILLAGEQNFLDSYIICPGAVVGRSRGPIKNGSFFLKFLTQVYQLMKGAIYVGDGTNEFYLVHLDDLTALYLEVLARALDPKAVASSPYARYYFIATEALSWKRIATAVGKALAKRGLLERSTPQSVSAQNIDSSLVFLGASQRINPSRASMTGWKPLFVDLLPFIDDCVDEVVVGVGQKTVSS